MNRILQERLKESNLRIEDILSQIPIESDKAAIFIYISHLEGFGNMNSDYDIYVITDDIPDILFVRSDEFCEVQLAIVNDTHLDIEYWKYENVYKLIDKVNSLGREYYNIEDFKFLHRLLVSENIVKQNLGDELLEAIRNSKLKDKILQHYMFMANSWLEDAINLYTAKEFYCALSAVHYALEYAAGVYNAKNKIYVVKRRTDPLLLDTILSLHWFS